MRHFSSRYVTSFVVEKRVTLVMGEIVSAAFNDILEIGSKFGQEDMNEYVRSFVFNGDRDSAHFLHATLAAGEFRAVTDFRAWYKELDEQFKYRSPSTWFRTTDFVYCNVNSGKCFVAIDGHYWD